MANTALTTGDHFFEADGVRFHYLVRGSGELLVCQSPGWGMPMGYLLNGVGPHLEMQNRVVYFEPRGNGESSKPADETTMTTKYMADDLEHLRYHLGVQPFPILFGHSNGACIVLRYAEQYPWNVGKLVIVDSQVIGGPPNLTFRAWIKRRGTEPAYSKAVAQLLQFMAGDLPQTDEELTTAMDVVLPYCFSDTKYVKTLRKHNAGAVFRVWCQLHQARQDQLPENAMHQVDDAVNVMADTLILWGQEDAMCSQEAAYALASRIPQAKLVLLHGVGHYPWVEAPERFFAAFGEFLWG